MFSSKLRTSLGSGLCKLSLSVVKTLCFNCQTGCGSMLNM